MKRSFSSENDDGPAPKCYTDEEIRQKLNEGKQFYKQVDTSGKVIWSGTVEISNSQKTVFDCSIKAHTQDEGIKSLFPLKQLTICIVPLSAVESLEPYKIQVKIAVLCMDENTDMMSCSAFSQAIRFDRKMVGCTVLKNSASALHLLIVRSFSYGYEDHILGVIRTYQTNDKVLGILRSHGLLPCVNLEYYEVLEKEKTELEEELKCSVQMLHEEQNLHQEQKELVEKKEGEIVSLQGKMEKQTKLIGEEKKKLTEMKKEMEEMNTHIMEKDKALREKGNALLRERGKLKNKDKALKQQQHEYKVLEKEKTELEEELKCRVQMLREERKLHQEQKELVEKKEGEIVSLQGDMEEKINLVEEQKMKLTEMEKKMEEMNTQIMEKDNARDVKDTKIMTLQRNQHKVEKMLKGALRIVSHSDAEREGVHNIDQSCTEADTEQILMMESSRLELQNEVTMKQAALDEIGNMMENEFRCSICAELFIKTVTLNCSHSFCAFCIQKWQKDKRTCPNCRDIITAAVRSVVLDSLIEKIIDKSGDEAKQRRNETLKERERDMQQEGQLCSIPKYVRHSDDETSTASSPASSLAHLSPSAAFMSPYNPPGTSYSMYSPYSYSPSHN